MRARIWIPTASAIALSACMAQPGDAIEDGRDGGTSDADAGARFHPLDFTAPSVHGVAVKLHELDCRGCHGLDLTGGIGPSCDTCHRAGWRTTCTFCHGGTADLTGAPPRDLLGETDPARISFRAHSSHVREGIHAAFDCSECHLKPADVLSEGHLFDDTPGEAEVDFSAGLSARGTYLGGGRCASSYCHGNGLGDNGAYADDRERPACTTCHPNLASGEDAWRAMSGAHREHLREDITCDRCHLDVVAADGTILAPALHVNREKDVTLEASMTRSGSTCSGTCHGELHTSASWNRVE